jgi:guanylate kinase
VLEALAQGKDVLLEIDWQGADQVRSQMKDTISIFILPPSRAELERRLRGRGSDSEETIVRRLADARRDLEHAREFDYVVVNDKFDSALDEIRAIVDHRRRGETMAKNDQSDLLADLLRI